MRADARKATDALLHRSMSEHLRHSASVDLLPNRPTLPDQISHDLKRTGFDKARNQLFERSQFD